MILLLPEGASPETLQRVESEVRRLGGEPRRLASEGGRIALEAKGLGGDQARGVAGASGIVVLEASSAFPRVSLAPGEERHLVRVKGATIGGARVVLIAGPCAVEDEAQLDASARAARDAGAEILRGGAFKPRTSPYSFQGMGEEGLVLLRKVADRYGLAVVTEVLDAAAAPMVAEHADMLQVGSRNMQNSTLLRAVGRTRRPVLLKRGMSATLEEWLLAAEYIADAGNGDIVLCERGVRTFDPASRNLLDLAAVPLLRERTKLPIAVDPSHGTGVRRAVLPMTLGAVAAGADAVMVECHPDPGAARSDGFQALTPGELSTLGERMRAVAVAVGRG